MKLTCDHNGRTCGYMLCNDPAPFYGPLMSELARPGSGDFDTAPSRACPAHTDGLAFIRSNCCGGTGRRIEGLHPSQEWRQDGYGKWVKA